MSDPFVLRSEDYSLYMIGGAGGFKSTRAKIIADLMGTRPFNRGRWQQLDVSESDLHATHELLNVTLSMPVPESLSVLQDALSPDLPWAEDHFWERVGGRPVNPGKTHTYWPYHGLQDPERHLKGKIYDHNYMERIWPKYAGNKCGPLQGIRFDYGDLADVITLLQDEPMTRQAYLPIWFPEDTGAAQKQRVPCSLGYHFIMDQHEALHCQYTLRSCEIYRHFTNDVYLACRLMQWVAYQTDLIPGNLTMHMANLHGFVGDHAKMKGLQDVD